MADNLQVHHQLTLEDLISGNHRYPIIITLVSGLTPLVPVIKDVVVVIFFQEAKCALIKYDREVHIANGDYANVELDVYKIAHHIQRLQLLAGVSSVQFS